MKITFLEVRNLDASDPMLLSPAPSVTDYEQAHTAIGPTLVAVPIKPEHSVWTVLGRVFHDKYSADIIGSVLKAPVKESPVLTLSPPFVEDPASLVGTTSDILYDYRGGFMWITGGHTIHRSSPGNGYVNQFTLSPNVGDIEDVRLNLNGRPFHARVKFE